MGASNSVTRPTYTDPVTGVSDRRGSRHIGPDEVSGHDVVTGARSIQLHSLAVIPADQVARADDRTSNRVPCRPSA